MKGRTVKSNQPWRSAVYSLIAIRDRVKSHFDIERIGDDVFIHMSHKNTHDDSEPITSCIIQIGAAELMDMTLSILKYGLGDEERAQAHRLLGKLAGSDPGNWKLAGMYVDGRAVELNTVTRELRFKEEEA